MDRQRESIDRLDISISTIKNEYLTFQIPESELNELLGDNEALEAILLRHVLPKVNRSNEIDIQIDQQIDKYVDRQIYRQIDNYIKNSYK